MIKATFNFSKISQMINIEKNTLVKICSWNVAGLRACVKKGHFLPYFKKEDPDILCLSETKCTLDQIPFEIDKKYKIFWNDCSHKAGYAGVGILSKYEPVKVVEESFGDIGDGRILTLEFEKFYLVNTYVPNAGEKLKFMERKRNWNELMRNFLLKLNKEKPFIWTGDLNVAYLDYDVYDGETNKNRSKSAGFTDYEREDFTKYFQEQNFVDIYRKFYPEEREKAMTFWSYLGNNRVKNRGWRLDYFIVPPSLSDAPKSVRVASDVFGSDHVPIVMEIDLPGNFEKTANFDKVPKKGKRKAKQQLLPFATKQKNKSNKNLQNESNKNLQNESKNLQNESKNLQNKSKNLQNESNKNLQNLVDNDWQNFFKNEFQQKYFKDLEIKIFGSSKNSVIYPPLKSVYSAFELTPLNNLKVVIIGQDPYHEENQAHGLSFSVQKGVSLPPSLKNIFKEAVDDVNAKINWEDGSLEKWAKEGVLLLNSVLTVEVLKFKMV
ncbi:hypothetical protein MHBO_001783 [Bonamia ostreae]|uniref:DNA-(apurinic or apyrimidinic site) endonuclease n=1 Tax=Bonamia ostreae TaxID=126728 RepID=A0ABV2AK58_9EUKA